MLNLLIVEDDPLMQDELRRIAAEKKTYSLLSASSGVAALQVIELVRKDPLIVLLDLGLPDIDGFAVLKTIAFDPAIAVIVVTAHSDLNAKLDSLAGGADAFLVKPFDPDELLLTLSAVQRRVFDVSLVPSALKSWCLIPRNWALHSPTGAVIKLTAVETQLLDLLHRHKGKPVSRGKIGIELGDLYRYSGNALEAMISRLRKKIASIDPDAHLVKAVSGAGYMLSTDVE